MDYCSLFRIAAILASSHSFLEFKHAKLQACVPLALIIWKSKRKRRPVFFSFIPDSSSSALLLSVDALPWNSPVLAGIPNEGGELPNSRAFTKPTVTDLRPVCLPVYEMFIFKCFTNISTSVFQCLKSLSPLTFFSSLFPLSNTTI